MMDSDLYEALLDCMDRVERQPYQQRLRIVLSPAMVTMAKKSTPPPVKKTTPPKKKTTPKPKPAY